MLYIVCDMNCNNFGNYFRIIAEERLCIQQQDKTGYTIGSAHYPKGHCYRARDPKDNFCYSEAIDYLLPKEYVKWKKNRFGEKK